MRKAFALAAVSTVLLASCQPAGPKDAIKLGYIGALTGDAAAIGADQLSGVRMAVEEVNAGGGIKGRMIELVTEDGKCAGTDAASAAQKLIHVDKVVAIVGGLCSGETLAAAPIAEAANIVMLSPSASSPDITDAGDFIFRDYPSDAWKTKAMAKYFIENNLKRIALISENTDYSQALRASLKKDLPEGTVVFDEVVDPGTKDFRSLYTRLKNVKFDVYVPNPNSDGLAAVMVQQFRDAGFKEHITGQDVMDSATVAEIAGDASEGVTLVNVPTAGEGTSFEESFTAKYGKPQSSIAWAAYSYDAANVLFKAFASVGTEGKDIRDYLYGMAPYRGIIGTFTFDRNGDPVGVSYVLKKFEGGKIMTVQDIPLD